MTQNQAITATVTQIAAMAKATREYFGDDFEVRHGQQFVLIGARHMVSLKGGDLKPMTATRFQDYICRSYGVTRNTALSDQNKLRDFGLIELKPALDDRRCRHLVLTDEGLALYKGFASTMASIVLALKDLLVRDGDLSDDDHWELASPWIVDFAQSRHLKEVG